jgi:hypothetical protein
MARQASIPLLRGISVEGNIGQQVDFVAAIKFVPSGDFNFITDGDDFTTIELEAEVQKDANGFFGIWTVRDTTPTV